MKIINELLPVETLGFGQYFAPLKARSLYSHGAWSDIDYSTSLDIQISSAAKVFHYAQEIFEGLKAYKQIDNKIVLFRPHGNIKRMNDSAAIMAMPSMPEELQLESYKEVVRRLKHLVPNVPGALYLRPTMIGTSDSLGVAPSENYEFFVIASPVGGYFKDISADKPVCVKIKVSENYVRAAHGGTGAAKTGGNYAASLRAIQEAKKLGYSNVLFLDSKDRNYVEELGGMNFFVVDEGVLKTPPLGDTILAGITRDSILRLAKSLDITAKEEMLSIHDVVDKIKKKKITEAFACGTAATISAISHIDYRGECLAIGTANAGDISTKLFKTLTLIFEGKTAAPEANWIVEV